MKPKQLALVIALLAFSIGFTSCKKTVEATTDDLETTFELSGDQAIADNLTEDANDIFMEAATENNLLGQRPVSPTETLGILGCATVTISPITGFPKKILIDFGTGCTSANGITRKGKINIALSDSVRKPGSTATLTFDKYSVNEFKKEGTLTWTNTSTAQVKGWSRKIENGKITNPAGKYWLHSGTTNVTQIAGYNTPRYLLDDVFTMTGTHTVTNVKGVSRTSEITEALLKETICENIAKGKIKVQGPNHYAIVDFGDGSCDRIATIAINGGTARTILLR